MGIKTRRIYVVMAPTDVLSFLKQLPDELCKEIIDLANYKFKHYKDGADHNGEGGCVEFEGDNAEEIFQFEYNWISYVFDENNNPFDFKEGRDVTDDMEYQYDENVDLNFKGICNLSIKV